jgi:toxin FitB
VITLLDTNVLSEMLRTAPSLDVVRWLAAEPVQTLYVSAVTQAEMVLGARLLPAGKRRLALQDALAAMFEEDFARRVLPFDSAAVPHYAEIVAVRRAAGRPVAQFDAQIAAIAACHKAQLATRNTADFEGCGLTLVNPWLA